MPDAQATTNGWKCGRHPADPDGRLTEATAVGRELAIDSPVQNVRAVGWSALSCAAADRACQLLDGNCVRARSYLQVQPCPRMKLSGGRRREPSSCVADGVAQSRRLVGRLIWIAAWRKAKTRRLDLRVTDFYVPGLPGAAHGKRSEKPWKAPPGRGK